MTATLKNGDLRRAFQQAVAQLADRGESATYASVRAAMGGVGSYKDIAPLMKALKEAGRHPMRSTPAAVEEQAHGFVQALWNSACSEAAVEIDRRQSEFDRRFDASSQDLETAMSEIKRLENIRDDFEAEVTTLRRIANEVRGLERHVADQNQRMETLREEIKLERVRADDQWVRAAELVAEVRALQLQKQQVQTPGNLRSEACNPCSELTARVDPPSSAVSGTDTS